MKLRDKGALFGAISIVNHWTIAALIVVMLALGLYMDSLPRGPAKLEWVQIHKSIGILVLVLGSWRVLWRIWLRFPEDIVQMPHWQEITAKAVHIALLLLIIAMPLSGYITSSTGGHAVSFFGFFNMPALPENRAFSETVAEVHEILANLLMVVLAVHVLAALKHHIFDKDATLTRMLGRAP
jgi:cytochrome b561